MKFAIFSDIHGNLEALEAVLADIALERVQEMICLGDIVGYGPNPAECLEMIRCLGAAVVMGNHDEACIEPGRNSTSTNTLEPGLPLRGENLAMPKRDWLRNRPMRLDFGDFTAVHASLSDSDEPGNTSSLRRMRAGTFSFRTSRLCFCGHTHRPAVWSQEGRKVRGFTPNGNVTCHLARARWSMSGRSASREIMRPEACYAIYNRLAHSIAFRFIPYDLKETQWKIFAAGLPPFLAQRLAVGR